MEILKQDISLLFKNIDTPCVISGFQFKNRLLNASGCHCTERQDLLDLAQSNSGGIVSKSCTLESRLGNPQPRYYETDLLSINSTGLANMGWKFYADFGETIKKKTNKPYIVSVAGIEKGDNIQIISQINGNEWVDMIELNLSCPNIIGKPQIGYDFEASDEILRKVFELNPKQPIGLKLPPYFDMVHFDLMADILSKYPIAFITCINSPGNGFVFNHDYKPSIIPKDGFGGIGGSIVKPFGLANVRKFHEKLPNIPIIGCGGITCKRDIVEYLLCGASMVQIGTELVKQGPEIFSKLND